MASKKSEKGRFALEIPYTKLKPEILRGIIEEFVLQEGTDYGEVEYNLEAKVTQVLKQLETGKASITFDPTTESCSLTTSKPLSG